MTLIRRFRLEDAAATREVFVQAVRIGAAGRYSEAERLDWVPDPAMPEDWGPWLEGHVTLVAEEAGRIAGFFMVERDGYLNMAFVRPDRMGRGLADRLYSALLDEVRALGIPRLHVLASRYAQGFFRRHGWQPAPEFAGMNGCDPRQAPQDNPVNRPMKLDPVPAA